MSDSIRVNDLSLTVPLLSGAQWPRDKANAVEQPIAVSLVIFHDVSRAAQTDDLSFSLNYAIIAKHVRRSIELNSFQHLQSLARHITDALSQILEGGTEVQIKLVQLRSPLHTKTVGIEYVAKFHSDRSWAPSGVTHFVEDLVCPAIIGVNPAEREEKQDVVVNLAINTGEHKLGGEPEVDLRNITKSLYEVGCYPSPLLIQY
jgi:dihydroneopterin aldolase/2-amino-4-hydroxy-6-hydroxymethyldihydropteridine diphosphokinase/dihydropteroate synthase